MNEQYWHNKPGYLNTVTLNKYYCSPKKNRKYLRVLSLELQDAYVFLFYLKPTESLIWTIGPLSQKEEDDKHTLQKDILFTSLLPLKRWRMAEWNTQSASCKRGGGITRLQPRSSSLHIIITYWLLDLLKLLLLKHTQLQHDQRLNLILWATSKELALPRVTHSLRINLWKYYLIHIKTIWRGVNNMEGRGDRKHKKETGGGWQQKLVEKLFKHSNLLDAVAATGASLILDCRWWNEELEAIWEKI